MIRHYTSRDPLVSGSYKLTTDAAKRLVLTPVSSIDKLFKASYYSLPFESYDDFINRIGFTPA